MEYYGITIAGIQVTPENCNNITGSYIKGKVSYNPETKTLTLDNATINGGINFGEDSSRIEDIIITLVGENTIKGRIDSVLGTKIINGTGRLKVDYIDCWYEENTIIKDCSIDLYANYDWNLYSRGIFGDTLTIQNANISAETNITTAIGNFDNIELISCEIVEPANAQIVDTEFGGDCVGKYICDEDGNIAKKVVIKSVKNK